MIVNYLDMMLNYLDLTVNYLDLMLNVLDNYDGSLFRFEIVIFLDIIDLQLFDYDD